MVTILNTRQINWLNSDSKISNWHIAHRSMKINEQQEKTKRAKISTIEDPSLFA